MLSLSIGQRRRLTLCWHGLLSLLALVLWLLLLLLLLLLLRPRPPLLASPASEYLTARRVYGQPL